jgi:site-specific recombinase XerD
MSERTQQMYVRAVRQLAEHYKKSPDKITEEELRQYFLHIKNVKKWSRTGCTIALCGIKFFYEKTLKRKWPIFNVVRPHAEQKLPVILSREQVREILNKVRLQRYRTCLATIYSCGLRLQEGTHLQVADIDGNRMVIHLRHGKGNKDRYVPLPQATLELLRTYWKTHRNPTWIFPASGRGGIHRPTAQKPMSLRIFSKVTNQNVIVKRKNTVMQFFFVPCFQQISALVLLHWEKMVIYCLK